MQELGLIHFKNREELRQWLENNYDKSPGIWMIYFKKHTCQDSVLYEEALEEALCFGWVDSIIKKIDEERYARKFTPRINTVKWSDFNKNKVFELLENGRMTQAGLNKIDPAVLQSIKSKQHSDTGNNKRSELIIPCYITEEFGKNEPALINFNKLAPSHKKEYVFWIINAKKQETIAKRISESIKLLINNKKLGLK